MRDALTARLGDRAAVVTATCAHETVPALRAAAGRAPGLVLLVLADSVPKLDRAMLVAAIGPLAAEFAPGTRVAALDLANGAAEEEVVAAALFLAEASSTTGQILRIAPR